MKKSIKPDHRTLSSKKTKPKLSRKSGLPPGSFIYIGKSITDAPQLHYIGYDEERIIEKDATIIDDLLDYRNLMKVNWFNVDGIHNSSLIESIGQHFQLHPLVLEDILNTEHRPKIEDYEKYIFLTFKLLNVDAALSELKIEQVSLILGGDFLLSFHEKDGDVFAPIAERIREYKGKIRRKSNDYLAYALLDLVVDNYYLVIETIAQEMDELEERIVKHPNQELLQALLKNKTELMMIRRAIFPLRDEISTMLKNEPDLITDDSLKYFRDVLDHTFHIMESVENFKEINSGLRDMYLSTISLKMNQVMQILTIFSTIFIPLTFIAGVYGMNFDNQPELQWKYGYFAVWGVMVTITITLLLFFRRRGWLFRKMD